jgi:hypothetical protein
MSPLRESKGGLRTASRIGRCFISWPLHLLPRILACLLFCLFCGDGQVALAGERFGLQGIGDLDLTNTGIPYTIYPSTTSQTNLSGQLILLGSLRIADSLYAFYEGRINHVEGLAGSDPRIQRTNGYPVVQAYIRYDSKIPWGLNIQVGKFGTLFGQFLARIYPDQNPLVQVPLMYSYRTTIPASMVLQDPEGLLSYRYRARSPQLYPYGSGNGWLPLINIAYPTGVMVYGNPRMFDYRFAVVNSSISNPLDLDQPGQRAQWVAGGGWTIIPGLRLGTSLAAGPYLSGSVNSQLPAGTSLRDYTQRALDFDFEYTFRHLETYGELLFTNFRVPNINQRLGASGYYVELKHTWAPRIYTALRWNQIFFDRLRPSAYSPYGEPTPPEFNDFTGVRFDYNINSLEVGLGFRITGKLLTKVSFQHDRTLGGMDPRNYVFAAQLVYSFDIIDLLRLR